MLWILNRDQAYPMQTLTPEFGWASSLKYTLDFKDLVQNKIRFLNHFIVITSWNYNSLDLFG